jgi:hypothetical protein
MEIFNKNRFLNGGKDPSSTSLPRTLKMDLEKYNVPHFTGPH